MLHIKCLLSSHCMKPDEGLTLVISNRDFKVNYFSLEVQL